MREVIARVEGVKTDGRRSRQGRRWRQGGGGKEEGGRSWRQGGGGKEVEVRRGGEPYPHRNTESVPPYKIACALFDIKTESSTDPRTTTAVMKSASCDVGAVRAVCSV